MKVLVTGADGLLGGNLVRELLGSGHEVRAFIQRGCRSPNLEGLSLERVEGDILDGNGALAEAMRGVGAVFHCAAITNQWAPDDLVWKVNFEGTRNVVDAAESEGVKKLVFTGSASSFQFGTMDRPGDETSPFPREYRGIPYMESKHLAAEMVRSRVKERGLDAVIVCPTFLLGPHDAGPSSGELIRQFIVRKLRFTSPGGRNFVHAGDAAKAMVQALEYGRAGESYILGGDNLDYMGFFTRVAEFADMEPPRVVLPKALVLLGGAAGSAYQAVTGKTAMINLRMARLSLCCTYYSPEKAAVELNMPHTPVEKAIEESIASLKQYGHIR